MLADLLSVSSPLIPLVNRPTRAFNLINLIVVQDPQAFKI